MVGADSRKRDRESPTSDSVGLMPTPPTWFQSKTNIHNLVNEEDTAVVPNSPRHHSSDGDDSFIAEAKKLRVLRTIETLPVGIRYTAMNFRILHSYKLSFSVEIIRMLSQPADIVAAGTDLTPVTLAIALPPDAPQLFVRAEARSCGMGGTAITGGLTLVEVRNGLADFRKLRVLLPEQVQAAQLQLAFSLCAVVQNRLQPLDSSCCFFAAIFRNWYAG